MNHVFNDSVIGLTVSTGKECAFRETMFRSVAAGHGANL